MSREGFGEALNEADAAIAAAERAIRDCAGIRPDQRPDQRSIIDAQEALLRAVRSLRDAIANVEHAE
jgi:hypothetical protein